MEKSKIFKWLMYLSITALIISAGGYIMSKRSVFVSVIYVLPTGLSIIFSAFFWIMYDAYKKHENFEPTINY